MAEQNNRSKWDTLAPEVSVLINGKVLPEEARADLVSVSTLEDVDATSMFTVTLLAWDGATQKVKWIDDKLFAEGNPVEIRMGYRDDVRSLLVGEITGLEPEFPGDEPPTLTVRGYDKRHRLMRKRTTKSFVNMKDSEIARQIATDAGIKARVEDTQVVLDYVLQHNQTDLEFLQRRAEKIDYELAVEGEILCFRPRPNNHSEVLRLTRQVELLEFFPRLNTLNQQQEVTVRGWNPKTKQEFVSRSESLDENKFMKGATSGPARVRQAFGKTGAVCVNVPVASQEEADQMAKAWFARMALSHVFGEGLSIGQPDLRAGSVVQIDGLGDRFSGLYYVISVEHSYKPTTGYRTAFSVKRTAT